MTLSHEALTKLVAAIAFNLLLWVTVVASFSLAAREKKVDEQ